MTLTMKVMNKVMRMEKVMVKWEEAMVIVMMIQTIITTILKRVIYKDTKKDTKKDIMLDRVYMKKTMKTNNPVNLFHTKEVTAS